MRGAICGSRAALYEGGINNHGFTSLILSNETSIERCNANIETKASANDIFRNVMSIAYLLRRACMSLIIASVILVKA